MISADLGPKLESFVADLVETGRYNSKSEVLREGVRLIQERETRLAVLDRALASGLADAGAGRITVLHILNGAMDVDAILFPGG